MQSIKAWLDSPGDYVAGIRILEENNGSAFYVKLLRAQGPTEFNRNKLRALLQDLCPQTETVADVVKPAPASKPDIGNTDTSSKPVQYPIRDDQQVRYLRLIEKRSQLYRQLEHNSHALDLSNDQDVLYETALQLKRLWVKLQETYAEIQYFEEHKRFPDPIPEKEIVTDEMQRLYVSIWKAEKRLEKPDCRNRYKTEALLKDKRERLQQLKDNG